MTLTQTEKIIIKYIELRRLAPPELQEVINAELDWLYRVKYYLLKQQQPKTK
ncbi:hypothetical protein IJE86_07845 [bacterium]|nr:hypothetical protein [bacterium]